jgi:hypothetical protein
MVNVKIEGVEFLDGVSNRDLWFIREIGTEDRVLSGASGGEMRLIAFNNREDAEAFIAEHKIANVEPFFKRKETKQ